MPERAEPRPEGGQRRGAGRGLAAVGRRGAPAAGRLARGSSPGARYAALGIPDGAGGFQPLPGGRDERRADRGDGPAAAHARDAWARCSSAAAPTGPTTSTTTRASAAGGPRQHPDMRSFLGVPIVARERGDRRLLPDREGGRATASTRPTEELIELLAVARRDRDHQRAPVRAQPRAVDPLRAQPAGARAARRRQPEAVQPHPDRRGRRVPCSTATRPRARVQLDRVRDARARGARRAALADPRPAPCRARARRARGSPAQGGRDARARSRGRRSSCESTERSAEPAPARATSRSCGSPTRRCTTPCATPRADARHGAPERRRGAG